MASEFSNIPTEIIWKGSWKGTRGKGLVGSNGLVGVIRSASGAEGLERGKESNTTTVKMSIKAFGGKACSRVGGFRSGQLKMIVKKDNGKDMYAKDKDGIDKKMAV